MKILHIAYTDTSGGAAIAMRRLVMALNEEGVTSHIWVRVKKSDSKFISGPKGIVSKLYNRLRYSIGQIILRGNKKKELHSINILPSNWHLKINNSDYDIIHLHWIGGETISIRDLMKITKPIVWTFHDMWPFSGSGHLNDVSDNANWITGYPKNRILNLNINWDSITWKSKKKLTNSKEIYVIAPSLWMEQCARKSILFKESIIKMIPNYIDLALYKKLDFDFCREALNLDKNKFIILFGAIGGVVDQNKGFDYLLQSLSLVNLKKEDVLCVVFGQSEPDAKYKIPFETKWLGHIVDDVTLALLYNAASVLVVPSKIDNFPQTATEAQSCGCPVVSFNTTGLRYLVEHKVSGYLAEPFSAIDLAKGIEWVFDNDRQLADGCVNNARRKWKSEKVLREHIDYYNEILSSRD